jgi:hypothetical protein
LSEYLERLAGEMLAEGRRAFALSRAVELAVAGSSAEDVIAVARAFERYLRGKQAEIRTIGRRHDTP